ncbi:MAG: methyltransferase domain-containing protein [Lentisphaeria bacterium]|nr:methyltransferase domain-containing protein [Lentisphaeria bacterium]
MSAVDRQLVQVRFNRSAETYDAAAPCQADMARVLLEHSRRRLENRVPQSILEVGCGTGTLTRMLTQSFPQSRLLAVDFAPTMLERALGALPQGASVQGLLADAEEQADMLAARGPFDLVISSATVQWFRTPARTVLGYGELLRPGGVCAVATFGSDTFRELAECFSRAEAALGRPLDRHVMPLLSCVDWADACRDCPHDAVETRDERVVVWYAGVDSLIRAVRGMGAGYAGERGRPAVHRDVYRRMVAEYAERFGRADNGHVRATYHLIYVSYRKQV